MAGTSGGGEGAATSLGATAEGAGLGRARREQPGWHGARGGGNRATGLGRAAEEQAWVARLSRKIACGREAKQPVVVV